MKIKRKNDSNRYVIRITHLLDGILGWSLITILVLFFQFTLFDEWFFLDYREKALCILCFLCIPTFIFVMNIFIKYPHFIIDFDKETIKIKKRYYPLKDIIKVEYIKKKMSDYDVIIVYMINDTFTFDFINGHGINIERGRGYPMARKIEEINNKLQEYRKQNDLD